MEALSTATTLPVHHQSSTYDETSMQESLIFGNSLKDLKNLRKQLYSAADHFELSYTNDDEKQLVVDTLKEYAIMALVNTADHLGSVTYKVNDLLDGKVEEVSGTKFRVSCIEQRLRLCQEYTDREGMAQQSSIIDTHKHHKRYVLPAGQSMCNSNLANLKYKGCRFVDDDCFQLQSAVRPKIRKNPSTVRQTPPAIEESASFVRRGRSTSPASLTTRVPGSFSLTGSTLKKDPDKRPFSPPRFPLVRSGSLASRPTTLKSSGPTTPKSSRPTTPKSSRPTTPRPALDRQQYLPDSWKSASMRIHDTKEKPKEIERRPSKSKRLLKALLSRRKPKKDDTLFTYLDEY